jgi:hypothetical protein
VWVFNYRFQIGGGVSGLGPVACVVGAHGSRHLVVRGSGLAYSTRAGVHEGGARGRSLTHTCWYICVADRTQCERHVASTTGDLVTALEVQRSLLLTVTDVVGCSHCYTWSTVSHVRSTTAMLSVLTALLLTGAEPSSYPVEDRRDNSTFTRCFSLTEHPDAVWEQCVYGDKGCPAACSGRGVCFFGVCHCKPGWLGSNCTAVESSRASCGLRGGVDLIDDACLQNSAAVIPAGRWRVAQAAEARLWASNSTRRERDSGVPHRSGRKQRGDRAWMHVKHNSARTPRSRAAR